MPALHPPLEPADVLPHRPPMLLLDRISDYAEDWIEAQVDIRADSPFAQDDGVPAWVGIEYMAQAVCAWSGIEQRSRGEAPGIGLLLGTRRYDSDRAAFACGLQLTVRAQLAWRDDQDLGAFECEIREGGTCIARGQLKVYRPADVHSFLNQDSP